MANKLIQILKDAFTKDIGNQPFIDGFAITFPRMNLGQLKNYYDMAEGKINPSDLTKYTRSITNYYADRLKSNNISKARKIWETGQILSGAICAFPLNLATWAATSILFSGAITALVYNKARAYLRGERIEEEGLTFPSPEQKL